MKKIPIFEESNSRACDGCTKCCDGWAVGEAHGYKFYPGRKCHFVCDTGCSIYESRPEEPCKTFKCLWLSDSTIPQWMKPDRIHSILSLETRNNISYITVKEAGKRLDASVLSWLFTSYHQGSITNIRYELDGGWNFIGTDEFIKLMTGHNQPTQIKKQL